jgi:hypothetical protein
MPYPFSAQICVKLLARNTVIRAAAHLVPRKVALSTVISIYRHLWRSGLYVIVPLIHAAKSNITNKISKIIGTDHVPSFTI